MKVEEMLGQVMRKEGYECDGGRDLKDPSQERSPDTGPSFAVVVDQYNRAKGNGMSFSCPDDEVEGELIYFQNKLLCSAISRKHFVDDLICKIVQKLPQEMEVVRKQRWDDVHVNQYLYELREARKQGRKERRHMEVQAVLAAATAAAAASSRISSLRKDAESSHQEINQMATESSRGHGGVFSRLRPHVKEGTSNLASTSATSDKHSDLTSVFSKEHPKSCDVCRRPETLLNLILICAGCKVAVHLDCYRCVKEYTGPWYCELCEETSTSRVPFVSSWERSHPVAECGLCGAANGAFRKSTTGQWVHAFCAEWVLDSTFKRGQVNPIEGMEKAVMANDVCSVCHNKSGFCIKCNYGNCQGTFHPSCGRAADYYMIAKNVAGKLQHRAYCEKHSIEQKAKAETQKPGAEEIRNIKRVRVELEKLRLLCERIVKREKLKRELVVCSHDVLASKRDSMAFSMLVRTPFLPAEVSSESATTSVNGDGDGSQSSGSRALRKSDDATVDTRLSFRRRIKLPVSIDTEQKTDDCSTSQHLPTLKPMDRVTFGGKQIPYQASLANRNIPEGGEIQLKSRKLHIETVEKELIMTSDQASMKNRRLPKGYIYVPVDCLSNEKAIVEDSVGNGDRDG
ncbi:Bromodomain-containing protein [Drosera capensis]